MPQLPTKGKTAIVFKQGADLFVEEDYETVCQRIIEPLKNPEFTNAYTGKRVRLRKDAVLCINEL